MCYTLHVIEYLKQKKKLSEMRFQGKHYDFRPNLKLFS